MIRGFEGTLSPLSPPAPDSLTPETYKSSRVIWLGGSIPPQIFSALRLSLMHILNKACIFTQIGVPSYSHDDWKRKTRRVSNNDTSVTSFSHNDSQYVIAGRRAGSVMRVGGGNYWVSGAVMLLDWGCIVQKSVYQPIRV